MSRPPVVFLVGFMGCGKTSVGRALAVLLGIPFIDLDDRIAHEAGKSVSAIFAEDGEPAFRASERTMLARLEPELSGGAVVATGGGTFADEAARAWVDAHGTSVWLDVSLETIERRVPRDGTRPLFGDPVALDALYQERRTAYASARLRVDADAPSPLAVARTVAQELRERERA